WPHKIFSFLIVIGPVLIPVYLIVLNPLFYTFAYTNLFMRLWWVLSVINTVGSMLVVYVALINKPGPIKNPLFQFAATLIPFLPMTPESWMILSLVHSLITLTLGMLNWTSEAARREPNSDGSRLGELLGIKDETGKSEWVLATELEEAQAEGSPEMGDSLAITDSLQNHIDDPGFWMEVKRDGTNWKNVSQYHDLIVRRLYGLAKEKNPERIRFIRQLGYPSFIRIGIPEFGDKTLGGLYRWWRIKRNQESELDTISFMLDKLNLATPPVNPGDIKTVDELRSLIEGGQFIKGGGMRFPWGQSSDELKHDALWDLAATKLGYQPDKFDRLPKNERDHKKKEAILKLVPHDIYEEKGNRFGYNLSPFLVSIKKDAEKADKHPFWFILEQLGYLPSLDTLRTPSDYIPFLKVLDVENTPRGRNFISLLRGSPMVGRLLLMEMAAMAIYGARSQEEIDAIVGRVTLDDIRALKQTDFYDFEIPSIKMNLAILFAQVRKQREDQDYITYLIDNLQFEDETRKDPNVFGPSAIVAHINAGGFKRYTGAVSLASPAAMRCFIRALGVEIGRRNGMGKAQSIEQFTAQMYYLYPVPVLGYSLVKIHDEAINANREGLSVEDYILIKNGFIFGQDRGQILADRLKDIKEGIEANKESVANKPGSDIRVFLTRVKNVIAPDEVAKIREEMDGILYRSVKEFNDPENLKKEPIIKWIKAVRAYQALLDSAEWMPRSFLLARDERPFEPGDHYTVRLLDHLCSFAKQADPTELKTPFDSHEIIDREESPQVWGLGQRSNGKYLFSQDPDVPKSLSGELLKRMKTLTERSWRDVPDAFRWIKFGPRLNSRLFVGELEQLLRSKDKEVQVALQSFMDSDDLWGRLIDSSHKLSRVRLREFREKYDAKTKKLRRIVDAKSNTSMAISLVTGEAWDLTGATPAHELDHSVMALVSTIFAALYSILVYLGWRIWIFKTGPPENWDQIKQELRQYPFSYLPRKINPIGNKPGVFIRAMALSTNDHHRLLRWPHKILSFLIVIGPVLIPVYLIVLNPLFYTFAYTNLFMRLWWALSVINIVGSLLVVYVALINKPEPLKNPWFQFYATLIPVLPMMSESWMGLSLVHSVITLVLGVLNWTSEVARREPDSDGSRLRALMGRAEETEKSEWVRATVTEDEAAAEVAVTVDSLAITDSLENHIDDPEFWRQIKGGKTNWKKIEEYHPLMVRRLYGLAKEANPSRIRFIRQLSQTQIKTTRIPEFNNRNLGGFYRHWSERKPAESKLNVIEFMLDELNLASPPVPPAEVETVRELRHLMEEGQFLKGNFVRFPWHQSSKALQRDALWDLAATKLGYQYDEYDHLPQIEESKKKKEAILKLTVGDMHYALTGNIFGFPPRPILNVYRKKEEEKETHPFIIMLQELGYLPSLESLSTPSDYIPFLNILDVERTPRGFYFIGLLRGSPMVGRRLLQELAAMAIYGARSQEEIDVVVERITLDDIRTLKQTDFYDFVVPSIGINLSVLYTQISF
ncbi:hypothetical protein BVX98_04940, partial [bacterium F11]